jgi:tetratricopeptide (TPR) repeat protein
MAHTSLLGWLFLCVLASASQTGSPSESQQTSSSPESHSRSQKAESILGAGLQYLDQARYQQAITAFHQVLELDPTLITARYDLGVAYFSSGEFGEARQSFQEVRRESPNHLFSLYFLARLDLIEEDLDGAIRGFQLLVSQKPVADEFYYLGSAHFRKGNMQGALRVLQKAAVSKPNDYRVPLLMARAYQKTGQSGKAEEQAALSEKLRDSYRRKSREILQCNTALNSQPLESALQQCQELLEGADSTKLVSLGVLLAERQLFDQAISPLAKAARLDPENFEPQFNLGLTYFRMKNYKDARKPLETAVSLRPEFYDAVALLGSVLFALGEDYLAAEHLRHAHQLRPSDEKVKSLLFEQLRIIGQHLFDRQEYKESATYLQEALSLKPDALGLQSQLAQATAALKNNESPKRREQQINPTKQRACP